MKTMRYIFLTLLFGLIFSSGNFVNAQSESDFQNWMHTGTNPEFPNGTQSETWYNSSAYQKKSETVIVAVLDSGLDTGHVDLKKNLWSNLGEIANNGIDDDKNGYIDDVYGWNFMGGKDGRSVGMETLELTREYAKNRARFEGKTLDQIKKKERADFKVFEEQRDVITQKRESALAQKAEIDQGSDHILTILKEAIKEVGNSKPDVEKMAMSENQNVKMAAELVKSLQEQGLELDSLSWLIDLVEMQKEEELSNVKKTLDYQYNPDYDSRKEIVGDNYFDFTNRSYGNNLVDGDFSTHGTHVAGIIGAMRENGEGMDGIADHVRIMGIKVVPDGDERDKDVANGIRYAVDNGAQVINMSFGKGYSPEKQLVDDAMRYAEKHDVLLVMGAGNDGVDTDKDPKFPNDNFVKRPFLGKKRVNNLLAVGALSPEGGESSIAEFSNYGQKSTDVFAPGVFIYATVPGSEYEYLSGTSMASPVVAGMAALIRSRYPNLSAKQVKDVIIKSVSPIPGEVSKPGTFEKVKASTLCVSGGKVNVPAAMKLASQTKGKAKLKLRKFKAEKATSFQEPGKKIQKA